MCKKINPRNEYGKIAFIVRLGINYIDKLLPLIIKTVKENNLNVLWLCDPMHGNTIITKTGYKTRNFDTIKNEIGALIYTGKQAKENFLIDDILAYDELIDKIIKKNNYLDYKIIKLDSESNFLNRYLSNYLELNYASICNKLNSNFISILPLFLNNC